MVKGAITVRDVAADEFVVAFAAHLKKAGNLPVPKWTTFCKTATQKELAPYDADWYYVRTASIARQVYLKPTIGVGALRHKYGGAKRRGTKPSHHNNSSGAIVRNALQGLETLGFVEKTGSGGRQITQKGQRELDRIASRVSKPVPPIGF